MRDGSARRAAAIVLSLTALTSLAAACDEPPAAGEADALHLDFDDAGEVGRSVWATANRGGAPVAVSVAVADDGRARAERSRNGSGRSLRLPAFDPWAPAPRAAVVVTPHGTTDGLDPGTGPLEFGADVVLDATTAKVASGSVDDGDNLVQRGLWNDPAQWKLELDRHRPTCRIKGRSGTVTVSASTAMEPGRWYRVRCRRQGSTVRLVLSWWRSDGSMVAQTWEAQGATGDLQPASRSTPVSAGGKVGASGQLDPDTDQCNARIDDVVVRLE